MSVVKPWMKQQDILNQMMSGMLQTVKKATNPALMAAKTAINPAAMRAIDSSKPGLKITYSQNAPTPPSWQTPPVLPTYVLQTYSMILQSMKQSSGAAAVGDAMSKKQVPAGDSIEKIQWAKNTPIRFMGRRSTARITREAVSDVLDVRAGRPPRRKSGPAGGIGRLGRPGHGPTQRCFCCIHV